MKSAQLWVASRRVESRALAQEDVGGALACGGLRALVAEGARVDSVQEMLSRAKQDRRDREVELIDQAGLQVLPDRRDAAAETDVAAARRGSRLLQRGANALGDEPELG